MNKLVIAILASLPLAAMARDNPDESFLKNAAEAGVAEVQAARAAQAKATNPAVKDFADMMVKEHSEANSKLKKLATAKGVELPDDPSLMQKALNKRVDMKSGESFDKDYIQSQIKAHQDTIELLQKEIDTGKDPQAKAFASETLPKVKMHLAKINSIAANEGVKQ